MVGLGVGESNYEVLKTSAVLPQTAASGADAAVVESRRIEVAGAGAGAVNRGLVCSGGSEGCRWPVVA